MKKILYVDMDNVLVNFKSGIDKLDKETYETYRINSDEVLGNLLLNQIFKCFVE